MVSLLSVPPRVELVVSTSGSFFGDSNRRGLLTRLEGQVNADVLAHFQPDILPLDLVKASGFCADRIDAGKDIGSGVFPGLVRGQSSRDASLSIGDGDGGVRDHAAALVGDASRNAAQLLCANTGRQSRKHQYPPQEIV